MVPVLIPEAGAARASAPPSPQLQSPEGGGVLVCWWDTALDHHSLRKKGGLKQSLLLRRVRSLDLARVCPLGCGWGGGVPGMDFH